MKLSSDSFRNHAVMPMTCAAAGDNRHPQLSWSEAPAGTGSLVLLGMDADAPAGSGDFFHWGLVDIPPQLTSIAEGALSGAANLVLDGIPLRQGINGYHRHGYDGPAPPKNHTHHYIFRLYALDVARLNLPAGFTCADVLNAIYGHIVDEAQLIGTYTHI